MGERKTLRDMFHANDGRAGHAHSDAQSARTPASWPSHTHQPKGRSARTAADEEQRLRSGYTSISPMRARAPAKKRSPSKTDEHRADDASDVGDSRAGKRKRVIIACEVCRRKKVRCQGLPNATNTCTNCANMGYKCTFDVETDRVRGRYEILESQKETLLLALRSVAPHLATQFEKGQLNAASLSEAVGTPESLAFGDKTGNGAEGSAADACAHDCAETRLPLKSESNPMVPDVEDGRPRFFGGSCTLHSFNDVDSRPSSPSHADHHKGITAPHNESSFKATTKSTNFNRSTKISADESRVPVPTPQYPQNSVNWVRELRRQTLVAIGRDEVFATQDWFKRFPLPPDDLLNQLLDFYFYRLNPIFPILHEYSLRRDLAMGRADRDSAFRGLLFTMITIASRFHKDDPRVWADPSDPESVGDHWAAASRFHHQVYAASLFNVQVSLLACAFMPSHLGIGTSWTVLGIAIRSLFDIGAHSERANMAFSPFEQERRRRTFWAAFCLDSILSINMGRPLGIRPADISVRFPLLATEDALTEAERTGGPVRELDPRDTTPCEAAGFVHLIKACTLVRDTLLTIYRPATSDAFPSHKPSGPRYKDMTILCKRLDEWTTEIPTFLQNIATSPFPLQATLIQCGRNNIRLYVLKPFLYDVRASLQQPALGEQLPTGPQLESGENSSILRQMLMPQCADHARATMTAVMTLQEVVGLPVHYIILHQSFLSASTFILTIWHGAKHLDMLRSDSRLIEFTLMMYNRGSRYASVLLRRAHKILRNVAARTLDVITDNEQRKRLQELILQCDLSFSKSPSDATQPENFCRDSDRGSNAARPFAHGTATARDHFGKSLFEATTNLPAAGQSHAGRPFQSDQVHRDSGSHFSAWPDPQKPNFGGHTHPSPTNSAVPRTTTTALEFNDANLSGVPVPNVGPTANEPERPPYQSRPSQQAPQLDALDVQNWLPTPVGSPTAFMQLDYDTVSSGHRFSGDLPWTDYFSRYIGGFLPDPQSTSDAGLFYAAAGNHGGANGGSGMPSGNGHSASSFVFSDTGLGSNMAYSSR